MGAVSQQHQTFFGRGRRDPVCSAATSEVHHVEWRSDGGEHSVHNCRGLCKWCHSLVHYHGYTLEPNGDATYQLRAPPGSSMLS